MERYEFNYLLATVPGIGVEAKTPFGETILYFYEDLKDSKGIERAMTQMYNAKNKGAVVSVTFMESKKRRERHVS